MQTNALVLNRTAQRLQVYYELTKPRIILLLLITTAAAVWVAAEGRPSVGTLLVTLLGGTLAAGAANTINCVYDRDIDALMERTAHRPLPSSQIEVWEALSFAGTLATLSFAVLTLGANLLSALLAMAGIVFYVLVYTHWLKRHSTQNIVIGGAAGAIPPLVGWAAVTGEVGWPAWVMFLIIFLWTPPHFWALALVISEDYAHVGVPMLPVVAGKDETVKQIWSYSLLVVPSTFLLIYPLGVAGWLYGAVALWLGIDFLRKAWHLHQNPEDEKAARSLFKSSLYYLMALCLAMVVDSLPLCRGLTLAFGEAMKVVISAIPIFQLTL